MDKEKQELAERIEELDTETSELWEAIESNWWPLCQQLHSISWFLSESSETYDSDDEMVRFLISIGEQFSRIRQYHYKIKLFWSLHRRLNKMESEETSGLD